MTPKSANAVTVGEIMTTGVLTVRPMTRFQEIVTLLLDYDISGLPVVDLDGVLIGMVSEADLISKGAYEQGGRRRHLGLLRDHLTGRDTEWVQKAAGRNARELMTSPVRTVSPETDLATAARIMLSEHVKRLPVVREDGKLIGILARHDLLRPLAGQRAVTV